MTISNSITEITNLVKEVKMKLFSLHTSEKLEEVKQSDVEALVYLRAVIEDELTTLNRCYLELETLRRLGLHQNRPLYYIAPIKYFKKNEEITMTIELFGDLRTNGPFINVEICYNRVVAMNEKASRNKYGVYKYMPMTGKLTNVSK